MNKRLFHLAILVIVFGMTAVGCDKSSTDDITGGEFVLTNVPSEYNGKYAWLNEIRNYRIGGFQESNTLDMLTGEFTLVKISNGRVNIPMWVLTDNGIERYTGNENIDVVIFIRNEESLLTNGIVAPPPSVAIIRFESVTFLKGNATKPYNDGEIEHSP